MPSQSRESHNWPSRAVIWARSGEFGTADVEAVADTAMALLDGAGVRMLIHDPAMELDRARDLVLWVASGLLASQPER